jgi:hypothetical protein
MMIFWNVKLYMFYLFENDPNKYINYIQPTSALTDPNDSAHAQRSPSLLSHSHHVISPMESRNKNAGIYVHVHSLHILCNLNMVLEYWLVVYLPLWKIWKSVGMMKFPISIYIYGKIKNVPNHQPEHIRARFLTIPSFDLHQNFMVNHGQSLLIIISPLEFATHHHCWVAPKSRAA